MPWHSSALNTALGWFVICRLYYFFNNTKPTGKEEWVATKTRVLFNLTGTKEEPVTDVTIKGVTMRDTRITYLDPHGMPSGGDWALQRSGAVFLQGTERCTVQNNKMVRLDGNAVFLSAYDISRSACSNSTSSGTTLWEPLSVPSSLFNR